MARQSIYEAYSLAESEVCREFPPVHPLRLAPALSDYNGPLLILGIVERTRNQIIKSDLLGREKKGPCTHINATICINSQSITLAFGAACSATTWKNGGVQPLHPELEYEYEATYGRAGDKNPLQQLFNGCWKWAVPGEVYREDWRACDSFIYVRLEKPPQLRNVIDEAMAWVEIASHYQVAGWEFPNCQWLPEALMEAADIELRYPFGSLSKPWPFVTNGFLHKRIDQGIRREGPFDYVSKHDVFEMFESVSGQFSNNSTCQNSAQQEGSIGNIRKIQTRPLLEVPLRLRNALLRPVNNHTAGIMTALKSAYACA